MPMRWRMLVIIFLASTVRGFQFQSVASVAPWLTDSFGLALTEIGTLVGVYMLPGVIAAIPGGALGNRYGAKPVVLAALALMGTGGVLAALAQGFSVLLVARLIGGTGTVLVTLLLTKMVTDWFAGREIIAAMGVMLSGWPFGLASAMLVQGIMAGAIGWQGVMLSTAGLSLLVLAFVALFYRNPPEVESAPAARFSALTGREVGMASLAGGIWTTTNIGFLVFLSFVPALLVARGAGVEAAGALASLGIWGTLVAVPLGGLVTQRIGRPNLSIAVACVLGCAALMWIAIGGDVVTGGVLIAVSAIPAGAMVALPAEALRAETRAAGLGIFYTWYYLGTAAGPPLAGWIGDRAGSIAAPVCFGAAMYLAGPPLLLGFRLIQRRAAVNRNRGSA